MASGTKTRKINPRIFIAGVVLALAFYSGLAGVSYFSSSAEKMNELESSLASQTIDIVRDSSYKPIPIVPPEHIETPDKTHKDMVDITEKLGKHDDAKPPSHVELQVEHKEVPPAPPAKHTEPPPHSSSEPVDTTVNKKIHAIAALSETVDHKLIPAKLSNDLPSNFDAYRKSFVRPEGNQGHIYAIVFYDFGLSQKQAEVLLSTLPSDITIALNPYSDTPAAMRDYLGDHEYESWMMLPIETTMFPMRDPGPQGLLSRSSYESNLQKLYWSMSRAQGYAGIVSYTDGAFAEAKPILGAIAKEVFDRGLAYVDLNSDSNQQIEMIAERYDAPYGNAALNFEKYTEGYSTDDFMKLAAAIVNNRDGAILVFPMSAQAISIAKQAYKLIEANGHVLAPLSYVIVQKPKPEIDLPASSVPANHHMNIKENKHEEAAHEPENSQHH